MSRKLRYGMIGGGPGSFIGSVHRIAAVMDGEAELICGAFSSSPEKSRETGEQLGLPAHKAYSGYEEMLETEKEMEPAERIHFVVIVTPNHMHFKPAKMAMEKGFDVVLDKPMTFSLKEAYELRKVQEKTGRLFCLTHTYTGYPMIKQARQIVKSGALGKIRKVFVEYPQGWLSDNEERKGNKQADWRTDPEKSGIAGCMGDIGTHAFHLAEYVTGLNVTALCAELNIVVPGRKLDDDGAAFLKFENGATGVLIATQVATGEENNLRIRVYGEKGGLDWCQEDCNSLQVKWPGQPAQVYRTGAPYNDSHANHNTRTPPGHPEGYLEAFANHYRNFSLVLRARLERRKPQKEWLDFPGMEDGVRGMAFVSHVVASAKSKTKWRNFEMKPA